MIEQSKYSFYNIGTCLSSDKLGKILQLKWKKGRFKRVNFVKKKEKSLISK